MTISLLDIWQVFRNKHL